MKTLPKFVIVRAKGRGFQVLPAGETRSQAQSAINGLLDTGAPADNLAVYEAQSVHIVATTTLTWGARRGRPPKGVVASKKSPKPPKKVKRPVKKPKKARQDSKSSQVRVPKALRRRSEPPKELATADAGGNGASA